MAPIGPKGLRPAFALCMALALTGPSLAQTSYTATELKPPFGYAAKVCEGGTGRWLGHNGDVAGLCSYTAGYTTLPDSFGLFPVPYSARRPVVWRAGKSAKVLSVPSGYDGKSFVGLSGTGRILGTIGEILRPNRAVTTPDSQVWWETNGSTRTPFTPGADAWAWSNVISSGQVAGVVTGLRAGDTPQIRVFQGNSGTALPLPPDVAAGSATLSASAFAIEPAVWLNDAGHLAVLTLTIGATPEAKVWVWNGSAWAALPAVPGGALTRLVVSGLNAQGQVLISSGGLTTPTRLHLWTPGSGWRTLEAASATDVAWVSGALAANGDVVGAATFPQAADVPNSGRNRAAIWRNGQHIDLNSLVPPPSGFVYSSILNVNAKGQLLARMTTTSASSSVTKLWLLTPR
jgi:hypothetical protein